MYTRFQAPASILPHCSSRNLRALFAAFAATYAQSAPHIPVSAYLRVICRLLACEKNYMCCTCVVGALSSLAAVYRGSIFSDRTRAKAALLACTVRRDREAGERPFLFKRSGPQECRQDSVPCRACLPHSYAAPLRSKRTLSLHPFHSVLRLLPGSLDRQRGGTSRPGRQ